LITAQSRQAEAQAKAQLDNARQQMAAMEVQARYQGQIAEAQATAGGEGLPPDLLAGKADAERRLTEAVAALEAIRLGLLRLTAGSGDVESLTTHLEAAGDIGGQIDRMLEGLTEAGAALQLPRGPRPGDTGPAER